MTLTVNSPSQAEPTQSQSPVSGAPPKNQPPLSDFQRSQLAESMAQDKFRTREEAREEAFFNNFILPQSAASRDQADGTPEGKAAAALVGKAATNANLAPIPNALQSLVGERAPKTQAFGDLQAHTSQSMKLSYNESGTASRQGPPLDANKAYALAHETVKQTGILSPQQMAPFDKKLAAGAIGGGAGLAVTGATASSGKTAPSPPQGDPSNPASGALANDPSVSAPTGTSTTSSSGSDGISDAVIYSGSIMAVMMMVLGASQRESAAEKQVAIGKLAEYGTISDFLSSVLTDKIGPATQELSDKISKSKKKDDSAKLTVDITDYPTNVNLNGLAPDGSVQHDTESKPKRASQSVLTQLNAELTQQQTTLQNNQQIATNKINSTDSQTNNTLSQMTSLLKSWQDSTNSITQHI